MTRYAKIGIFFTVCTVLVSVYIYRSADLFMSGKTRVLYALAEDAMGILNDSDIVTAGVVVGKVGKIELEGNKAKITLNIWANVPVYKNASIEKVMESMLGTYVFALNPGDNSYPELKEFDYIENVRTTGGISGAMEKASVMMEKAAEAITMITGDNNQEKLNRIIEILVNSAETSSVNFDTSMKLLAVTLKNMSEITHKINVRSNAEMDKFSKILENTILLTEKMNNMMDNNDRDISDSLASLRETLQIVSEELKTSRGAIENLRNISEDVNKITGKIADGEGNVGKLLADEKLYEDLSNISGKLSEYADTVLGMQVHVDFHSDYMVFSNDFKTYFDITLQPREDRFYLLGVVDDPKGRVTETSNVYEVGIDDGTDQQNYTITENKTKRDSELKFNIQLGRIFGPIALRGGIFENKAGFGMDYTPWKAVSLSTEFFDFGGDLPQLRVKGLARPLIWAVEPFSWLYITAGGENLINKERDLYFGLGLRFTDNDLKTILTSVPTP
jgi:phospholipid/cholesterol/gamma-HCH transport system substrate-binding protein